MPVGEPEAPVDPMALAVQRGPRELTPDEMDRYEIGSARERARYRSEWEAKYPSK
jgi:hypothetical protein